MSFFLWVMLSPWGVGRFSRFVGRLSVDLAEHVKPSSMIHLALSMDYRMDSGAAGLMITADWLTIRLTNAMYHITIDR